MIENCIFRKIVIIILLSYKVLCIKHEFSKIENNLPIYGSITTKDIFKNLTVTCKLFLRIIINTYILSNSILLTFITFIILRYTYESKKIFDKLSKFRIE